MTLHALDLDEIRTLIGIHLDRHSLQQCTLVCSSWRASFSPLLCRSIHIRSSDPPSSAFLHSHARHIHQLTFKGLYDMERILTLQGFSSLTTVAVHDVYRHLEYGRWNLLAGFVARHVGTIRELILEHAGRGDHSAFWKILQRHLSPPEDTNDRGNSTGCRYDRLTLDILILSDHAFLHAEDEPFFQRTCQTVDSLLIKYLSPGPAQMQPTAYRTAFSRLTLLNLRRLDIWQATEQLLENFMRQTPNLEELYIRAMYRWLTTPSTTATGLVSFTPSRFCWPKLRVMRLGGCWDSLMVKVLGQTGPSLRRLDLQHSGFGRQSFLLLKSGISRTRRETLLEINLEFCRDVTSEMVQFFLSTCPSLESIIADRIDAVKVASEAIAVDEDMRTITWVCKRLKVFRMNVEVDVSARRWTGPLELNIPPSYQRLAIFRHLGSLHQLEVLHLNRNGSHRDHKAPLHSVYIELGMGLEELAGLSLLREFVFKDQPKNQGKLVAEWMVKHWPRLQRIAGRMNGGEDVMLRKGVRWDVLHGGNAFQETQRGCRPFED